MNYKTKKISELFSEIKIGGTPNRGNSTFFGGTNLWVSIKDMEGQPVITNTAEYLTDSGVHNSNCKLVKKGSLLFSFKLTVGRISFAGRDLFTNEAIAAFDPDEAERNGVDLEYLSLVLPIAALVDTTKNSMGAPMLNKEKINELTIPVPEPAMQREIASRLNGKLAEIEKARKATEIQILETANLANAIVYESVETGNSLSTSLGDVLDEVKKGIGKTWKEYLVLGATRNGLALAKEPPGKKPERYKPIFPGTVFYNPMRILIGSIAFVDEDDTPGITSPDYVALKGKEGVVDSRWFYYWLRSQYGKTCINSLARGAVRERMLFNRLADGKIELPEFKTQQKASEALKEIKAIRINFEKRLKEIELLPNKLLIETFEKIGSN